MDKNCLKILNVERSTNPWYGMTGLWEEEEANRNIKALFLNNIEFSFSFI